MYPRQQDWTSPTTARAVAAADWDFDGDLDLWLTARTAPRLRFMQNRQSGTNRFVAVQTCRERPFDQP